MTARSAIEALIGADAQLDAGDRVGAATLVLIGAGIDGGASLALAGASKILAPAVTELASGKELDSNHRLLELVRQAKWQACELVLIEHCRIQGIDLQDTHDLKRLGVGITQQLKAVPAQSLDARDESVTRDSRERSFSNRFLSKLKTGLANSSLKPKFENADKLLLRGLWTALEREPENQSGTAAPLDSHVVGAALTEFVIQDVFDAIFATPEGRGKSGILDAMAKKNGIPDFLLRFRHLDLGWHPTFLVIIKGMLEKDDNAGVARRLLAQMGAETYRLTLGLDARLNCIVEALSSIETDLSSMKELQSMFERLSAELTKRVPLIIPGYQEPDDILSLTFGAEKSEFVGRQQLLSDLDAFRADKRRFLWWQIGGPGGQGKSRLALHAIKNLSSGWRGGFLDVEAFNDCNWDEVSFPEPTIIVVDYVAAPQKAIAFARVIERLKSRVELPADHPKSLRYSVRLLALDRSAFDFSTDSKREPNWTNAVRPADALRDGGVRWQDKAAIISHLDESEMLKIANSYRERRGKTILTDAAAKRLLKMLDSNRVDGRRGRAWRPLFAMMLADRAQEGRNLQTARNNIDELLDSVLARERDQHWKNKSNSLVNPTIGAKRLGALTTIVSGMNLEDVFAGLEGEILERKEKFYGLENPNHEEEIVGEVWLTLGRNYIGSAEQPKDLLPRQPDLLGEYLILWVLGGDLGNRKAEFVATELMADAWRISVFETIDFLIRVMEDFPHHPAAQLLANQDIPEQVLSMLPDDLNFFAYLGLTGALQLKITAGSRANQIDEKNGAFPLLLASQEGHTEVVAALLNAKADPSQINEKDGAFPLLVASQEGHTEVAAALLNAKADPSQINEKDGAFPLLVASQEGHTEVAAALLNAKADPSQIDEKDGAFPLLLASQNGHTEAVAALLNAKADPSQINEKTGSSPLLLASQNGHTEVVAALLNAKADPSQIHEKDGVSPLLLASQNGHTEVVAALLNAKADPSQINEKTGSSPLLLASQDGHTEAVAALLNAKSDPSQINEKDGAFPLLLASQNGHTEVAAALLNAKADPSQIHEKSGAFPLLLASQNGHTEVVAALLNAKADLSQINEKDGAFPLLVASQEGHTEAVAALLNAKADPSQINEKDGAFPLLVASQNGHTEAVAALLNAKADPSQINKKSGAFPLLLTSIKGHTEVVATLLNAKADPSQIHEKSGVFPLLLASQEGHTEVVATLLNAKADPSQIHEKSGVFPLLLASQEGHTEAVAALLNAKADPSQIHEKSGALPLLVASQEGHTEVVAALLNAKADPSQINEKDGVFPLLFASQEGHTEAVAALLNAKADPSQINEKDGVFPLLVASQEGHTEAVAALLNAKADPSQIHEKSGAFPLLVASQNGHTEVVALLRQYIGDG